jgi:uncharacterized membrane protein YhdT
VIVVVGLIHLIGVPEDLEEAPYQGLLFLANFFGAILAAIGIYRGRSWGWSLGVLVSVGALVAYVISRTVGLPGLPVEEEWLEILGLLSLLVDVLFVGLCLMVFAPLPSRKGGKSANSVPRKGCYGEIPDRPLGLFRRRACCLRGSLGDLP